MMDSFENNELNETEIQIQEIVEEAEEELVPDTEEASTVVFGNVSDEDYDKERVKNKNHGAALALVVILCILIGAFAGFAVCHWYYGQNKNDSSNGNDTVLSGSLDDGESKEQSSSGDGKENNGGDDSSYADEKETDNQNLNSTENGSEATDKENSSSKVNIDGVTELSTAEIYESCVNSVVGITAEGTTTNIFGQVSKNASTGTGIVYSSDGYILTNYHVVEAGTAYTVTLYNGDTYKAALVGYEADNDVALIKIDAKNLQGAVMGNSDNIAVGKDVIVIGNPLGELTYTLTRGVVSALNRVISTDGTPKNMFQIDAAVNSGNSGGPAFDATGKVIGIVTAKYAADTVEGIGFCIPINDAVKIAEELKEYGYIRGKTAVGICVLDSYLTYGYSWFNQGVVYGAKVTHIDKSYDVAKSGLAVGDLIVAVDDTRITSASDLQTIIKTYSVGEKVKITAYHAASNNNYEEVTYTFNVGEYSPDIAPENWSKDTYGEAV